MADNPFTAMKETPSNYIGSKDASAFTGQKGTPSNYMYSKADGSAKKPSGKGKDKPDVASLRKELMDRKKRIQAAKEDGTFDDIRSRFNEQGMKSGVMMNEFGEIFDRSTETMPMPKNRTTGGVRKKGETEEEFRGRMDAGIPRGTAGKGGLSSGYALQDRNLTAEEAGMKGAIIEGEGGQLNRDGSRSKRGIRPAPQSSTGRDYDPVAARERMMGDARAAVAAKKEQQAADDFLLKKREEAARTPGTSRGFANKYGTGQATTLTPEQFAKRKPATVTEGGRNPAPNNKIKDRNMPQRTPITNDLREVLGFMDKEQQADRKGARMPPSGFQERLDSVAEQRKRLASNFNRDRYKDMAMSQGKSMPRR
jgi:hypothetical protein